MHESLIEQELKKIESTSEEAAATLSNYKGFKVEESSSFLLLQTSILTNGLVDQILGKLDFNALVVTTLSLLIHSLTHVPPPHYSDRINWCRSVWDS